MHEKCAFRGQVSPAVLVIVFLIGFGPALSAAQKSVSPVDKGVSHSTNLAPGREIAHCGCHIEE
jgi:hypothetical protein